MLECEAHLTRNLPLDSENHFVEKPVRIRLVKSTEVKTACPFASSDGSMSFTAYMLPKGYEADAEELDGKFLFNVDSIPLTVSKRDVEEITSKAPDSNLVNGPAGLVRRAFARMRS